MGWSDEQIRQRIEHDDEAFSDAISGMADVIMGEHLARMVYDDRIKTKDAIEEILKYYRIKPRELPEKVTAAGDQLEHLMRPAGVMWRTVELRDEWYKDAVGPMLGTRSDDGSAVALMPRGFSGYDFFDVGSGRRIRLNKKTASMIDAQAICFYKPFPVEEIGLGDLIRYLLKEGHTSDYVRLAAAALATALIGLLPPFLNQLIYSQVIPHNSAQLLLSVFTFLICALLSQTLIQVYKTLVLAQLTGKMNVAFQAAGMARLLSMPVRFFKKYSSGNLASRMNNLGSLCTMLVDCVFSAGLTALFSLVYVGQMLHYGAGLVVPAVMALLLTVGVSAVSMIVEMKLVQRAMEMHAKESGLSYALVTGIQKIKLAGAEKRAFAKWANAYTPVARLTYAPPLVLKVSKVLSLSIPLIGTLIIYYFTIRTHVPLADYYAFQAAYGMVVGAFTALISMASGFAQIKPIMELLRPLLKTVPEVGVQKKMVERLSGSVELSHVTFRYEEDSPNVIHDLSLSIRPGQYVAIVGKTGCGKSTLMRLLLGFESPQKGAIYYDGKDLDSLDLKSLRRNIGVVMQNGKLFQGDIFSNIAISAPWITMDDAWRAAEMAGIAQDIRRMPMGMYTMISEGSGGVSGGQRQRLMIARAVAANPRILMFDEATSALDNLTQKRVSQSLDQLKCTRIVIAHRLSTIRNCDRILVLDQGRIAEEGSYDDLIRRDGLFAQLVRRQQLDGEQQP